MVSGDDVTLLRRLVPVAEEHGGLVSVVEAERAGVSNRMLLHYASAGDLERMHRGIYRLVWLPRHRFADVIAACLRIGSEAVAVDDTAAAVWGLGDAMPAQVGVAVPKPWRGKLPGVQVAVRALDANERTIRDAVPVTSLERTLADLAEANPGQADNTIREARRTGCLSDRAWHRATRRYPALRLLDVDNGGRR